MKILAGRNSGEVMYNEFIGKATRFGEYLNNKINCGLSIKYEFPKQGVEKMTIKLSGYDEGFYGVVLTTSEINMTRYDEIVFSSFKKCEDGKYKEVSTTKNQTTNGNKIMTEYEKFLINSFYTKYEKELADFTQEYDDENVHTYLMNVVEHIAHKQRNSNVIKNIIKTINTSK